MDGTWFFAINGHDEPTPCSRGPKVSPFHVYVEFNGRPADALSAADGLFASEAGAAANEDAFVAALKKGG